MRPAKPSLFRQMENKIILYVLGLGAIIASSYISFDVRLSALIIPFTAQSLAVFVVAGLVGTRTFLAIILSYLILGTLGLPIFAGGSSGLEKLLGPSGGFLIGFLFSGVYISQAIKSKDSFGKHILIMLLATLILFLFGLAMLTYKFDWSKALQYGFYPYWPMALVKAGLSACIVFYLTRHRQTKNKA